MTDLDLDRIEALADAATPGPWTHIPYSGQNQNGDYAGGYVLDAHGESILDDVYDPDGAFIAGTGPDVVKELVRQVREARSGLADAWDQGHGHCFHVEDPANQKPYNPYRSDHE